MPPSPEKFLANDRNKQIAAALHGLFRFATRAQALDMLTRIRERFIISRKQSEADALLLWVKDFGVTPEEKAQGFLGHYACIRIVERDNAFTLAAEKTLTALAEHPQRRRPKRQHVDWGHPVMRQVRKGALYASVEAAMEALAQLHRHFPDTSIPGTGKLHIMVYSKTAEDTSPVQKITLKLREAEGNWRIEVQENKRPPQLPRPERAAPQGRFTALVVKKKKR